MTTLHAPDMYVVIGDEYAKRLGYEGLVGSMGIIDSVLNTLCGVTILSGNPEMIGKQTDIHMQDCILQEYGGEHQYSVVINTNTGRIYYSEDKELVEYTRECIHPAPVRMFHGIRYMHEVLDFCAENLQTTRRVKGYEWIMFCLDDESCEETKAYRDTFEAHKNLAQQEEEAFKKVSKSTQVLNLTAQLQKQMEDNSLQKQVDELFAKHKEEGRPAIEEAEEEDAEEVSYKPDDWDDDLDPYSYR